MDLSGEHDHEHAFEEIAATENITAFEETTHHLITLEFHDRGLSLTLDYAQAYELLDAMQKVLAHIGRGRTRNGN
jgi:hypothetical protein